MGHCLGENGTCNVPIGYCLAKLGHYLAYKSFACYTCNIAFSCYYCQPRSNLHDLFHVNYLQSYDTASVIVLKYDTQMGTTEALGAIYNLLFHKNKICENERTSYFYPSIKPHSNLCTECNTFNLLRWTLIYILRLKQVLYRNWNEYHHLWICKNISIMFWIQVISKKWYWMVDIMRRVRHTSWVWNRPRRQG